MSDFQEIDEIVPLNGGSGRAPVTPDPEAAMFDLSPPVTTANVPAAAPVQPAQSPPRKGVAGVLVAIGAALAKWWAVILSALLKFKGILVAAKLLTAGKLLLTGGTMLLSMFLWSYRFGWPMAAGLVISIFIHECGHALASYKLGHKLGIMVFIPFCGAIVTGRGVKNVTEGAFLGIMGPVAGTLTAVACVGLFAPTHNVFWLVLATLGFMINLINLTPGRPLDGGWIVPLFSPKLLLPGIVLAVIVFHSNPVVWLMAIMSVPGTIYAWRHGHESPYFQATTRDRWTYGLAYLGLIVFLGCSVLGSFAYLRTHYRRAAPFRNRGPAPRSQIAVRDRGKLEDSTAAIVEDHGRGVETGTKQRG